MFGGSCERKKKSVFYKTVSNFKAAAHLLAVELQKLTVPVARFWISTRSMVAERTFLCSSFVGYLSLTRTSTCRDPLAAHTTGFRTTATGFRLLCKCFLDIETSSTDVVVLMVLTHWI
jgi:hypothetical protein